MRLKTFSEVKIDIVKAALTYCGGNQSKAARVLGISRSTLRKYMTQTYLEHNSESSIDQPELTIETNY
jgi:DNA-binding NtrC family response regulator